MRKKTTLSVITTLLLTLFPLFIRGAEIHDAAAKGELPLLKGIIQKDPAAVNLKNEQGRTPLHLACRGVHLEMVTFLAENGADLNAPDNGGYAPLHHLAFRGHTAAIAVLLEKGAHIDIPTRRKETPLHYAVGRQHEETVNLLLAKGANLEVPDIMGRTPLLFGIRNNVPAKIIKRLVDKGADINAVDNGGEFPLLLAAWRGNFDCADVLLDKKANIPREAETAWRLISQAAVHGMERLFAEITATGTDLSGIDKRGKSLLHFAASGGSVKIVDQLINQKIDINKKDINGWTPLHYAAEMDKTEVITLLAKKGASLDTRNLMGNSPYNLAVEEKKPKAAQLLLSLGASNKPRQFPVIKGDYLGQPKPGKQARLFAPGIVSAHLGLHSAVTFSPDCKEAYWNPMFKSATNPGWSSGKIVFSRLEKGQWTAPRKISFADDKYDDNDPFVSCDGKRLYFTSNRPLTPDKDLAQKENIWYAERNGQDWSVPKPLSPVLYDLPLHWQFSLDKNHNLYFRSQLEDSRGSTDIYVCRFIDGKYEKPQNLGDAINTKDGEDCPFISPDGDYLIFNRNMDLFVSYRDKAGKWEKPRKPGNDVNSPAAELCGMVSPDGKYLFFLSTRAGESSVYWVEASVLKE